MSNEIKFGIFLQRNSIIKFHHNFTQYNCHDQIRSLGIIIIHKLSKIGYNRGERVEGASNFFNLWVGYIPQGHFAANFSTDAIYNKM